MASVTNIYFSHPTHPGSLVQLLCVTILWDGVQFRFCWRVLTWQEKESCESSLPHSIILGGIVEGANGARFEGPLWGVVALTCLREVMLPLLIIFHTSVVIVIITQTRRLASSRKPSSTRFIWLAACFLVISLAIPPERYQLIIGNPGNYIHLFNSFF